MKWILRNIWNICLEIYEMNARNIWNEFLEIYKMNA